MIGVTLPLERLDGHDHPGCAEPALNGSNLDDGPLNGIQPRIFGIAG
jgi:hypothetical protein